MKKTLIITMLLFAATAIYAQDKSIKKIYISRPKRADASLIKFNLLVNGERLTFPNNSYAELEIKADSVKVELDDPPSWMKTSPTLVTKDSATYFSVFAVRQAGLRKEVITIEKICKTCYEDSKKTAKKKIESK